MTLPKSHKNPAAYSEHMQARTHAPMTSKYGEEKGNHPNRQVSEYDSLKAKWQAGEVISSETPEGMRLRRDLFGYD